LLEPDALPLKALAGRLSTLDIIICKSYASIDNLWDEYPGYEQVVIVYD